VAGTAGGAWVKHIREPARLAARDGLTRRMIRQQRPLAGRHGQSQRAFGVVKVDRDDEGRSSALERRLDPGRRHASWRLRRPGKGPSPGKHADPTRPQVPQQQVLSFAGLGSAERLAAPTPGSAGGDCEAAGPGALQPVLVAKRLSSGPPPPSSGNTLVNSSLRSENLEGNVRGTGSRVNSLVEPETESRPVSREGPRVTSRPHHHGFGRPELLNRTSPYRRHSSSSNCSTVTRSSPHRATGRARLHSQSRALSDRSFPGTTEPANFSSSSIGDVGFGITLLALPRVDPLDLIGTTKPLLELVG
jgi:hypothetical protein